MDQDTTKLEGDVKAAVESDPASIAERVRGITLSALSEGRLDGEGLRQVMGAVLKGAQQGVAKPGEQSTAALKEAVRGLDEALAAAAQATQLAIQEAAGRTGEFSREGLKTRTDELAGLESRFLDTLTEAARNATGHVQETLRELAAHSRASGTAVGGRVQSATSQLARALADAAQDRLEAGARTVRNEAGLLAGLAAGMLRGIADTLQSLGEKGDKGDKGDKDKGQRAGGTGQGDDAGSMPPGDRA